MDPNHPANYFNNQPHQQPPSSEQNSGQRSLNGTGRPPASIDLHNMSPAEREFLLRKIQQQHMLRNRQLPSGSAPRPPGNTNGFGLGAPPSFNQLAALQYQQSQQPSYRNPAMHYPHPAQQFMQPSQHSTPAQQSMQSSHSSLRQQPPSLHPLHEQMRRAQMSMSHGQPLPPAGTAINPQFFANPFLYNGPSMQPPAAMNQMHMPPRPPLMTPSLTPVPETTINPQQLHAPHDSSATSPSVLVPRGTQSSTLAPLDEQVMSSEGSFTDHLIRFLNAFKVVNRRVPSVNGRPLNLFRLFQVVTSAGGYNAVTDARRWPLVVQALQLPASDSETVAIVQGAYCVLLHAYEQFFVQQRPADRIEWPVVAADSVSSKPPAPQRPNPPLLVANPPRPHPHPHPHQLPVPPVSAPPPFIPDSDAGQWRQFARPMAPPPGTLADVETITLCMTSPRWALRLEALASLARIVAEGSREAQLVAGLNGGAVGTLLQTLHALWREVAASIPTRTSSPVMEDLVAQTDCALRDISVPAGDNQRDLAVCRQIAFVVRLLAVVREDLRPQLATGEFVGRELLSAGLLRAADYEIYKDTLIILEALAAHLPGDTMVGTWILAQTARELASVTTERMLSHPGRIAVAALAATPSEAFCSVAAARQAVATIIAQSAQLWKAVPGHIHIHLTTCLHLLSHRGLAESVSQSTVNLTELAIAVSQFAAQFVLPAVALLRSVRGLYEVHLRENPDATEDARRLLDTVFYSPAFNFTDGGFLELSLLLLEKCLAGGVGNEIGCWREIVLLVAELRLFWMHSEAPPGVVLARTCYQSGPGTEVSPSRRARSAPAPAPPGTALVITRAPVGLVASFSHPFMVLARSLDLLAAVAPAALDDGLVLLLAETVLAWDLDRPPSRFGAEVLLCDRFAGSLALLRDSLFTATRPAR